MDTKLLLCLLQITSKPFKDYIKTMPRVLDNKFKDYFKTKSPNFQLSLIKYLPTYLPTDLTTELGTTQSKLVLQLNIGISIVL